MNTPTTLDLSGEIRSIMKTCSQAATLSGFASLIAKVKASLNSKSSKAPSPKSPDYRLGEVVSHAQFGAGRVKALWPDGTILVRFDGEVQSRLVFPTLLQGVNGYKN